MTKKSIKLTDDNTQVKNKRIPQMLEIFQAAKKKMRASGNMLKWEDGYPSDEILRNDISRGFSYMVEEDGKPVATFVLAICTEPTYNVIYDGKWLDDSTEYATIHRIASLEGYHGVMKTVLDFGFSKIGNIRIDTHRDNHPMQHMMQKYGFTYCGIIHLASGYERLAYQKILMQQQ